jgi:hypothetical protein
MITPTLAPTWTAYRKEYPTFSGCPAKLAQVLPWPEEKRAAQSVI